MCLDGINNKSREPWLYSPPQLSPVHHGEKSNLQAYLHTNLDITPKLEPDLENFISLPITYENHPLEIPHLTEIDELLSQKVIHLPSVVSQEITNVMRKVEAESSGIPAVSQHSTSPKLKLEMEMFGDLSSYCQASKIHVAKSFQNDVDELNTPVFEKAPFNYDRPPNAHGLPDVYLTTEDPFNFKIKSELSNAGNVNIKNMDKEDVIVEGERNDITPTDLNNTMGNNINNYTIVMSSQEISANNSVFNPNHSEYTTNIFNHNTSDKVTPIYNKLIGEEDEYLTTVNNCSDIYIDNNSFVFNVDQQQNDDDAVKEQYILLETAPFDTPDNSLSASDFATTSNSKNLTLTIDNKFKNVGSIDTPDVIETINAIENDNGFVIGTSKEFNILNFINEEDSNDLVEPSTPSTSSNVPETPQSSTISSPAPQHPKRKSRPIEHDDDDDSDYEPPSVKRKTTRKPRAQTKPILLFERDLDDEDLLKPTKRGRPPKRLQSISSEDYNETDGKYREMRDKNNEASRKSRLKRKIKEMAQQEEAEGLLDRNIKLKAQVSELEKTVNTFRNNLMQILMKG